jgi:hypothetical protein
MRTKSGIGLSSRKPPFAGMAPWETAKASIWYLFRGISHVDRWRNEYWWFYFEPYGHLLITLLPMEEGHLYRSHFQLAFGGFDIGLIGTCLSIGSLYLTT